jgi:hypothetical protein
VHDVPDRGPSLDIGLAAQAKEGQVRHAVQEPRPRLMLARKPGVRQSVLGTVQIHQIEVPGMPPQHILDRCHGRLRVEDDAGICHGRCRTPSLVLPGGHEVNLPPQFLQSADVAPDCL